MHRFAEVFLDESGDLGSSPLSSRYFVVVAVATTRPEELKRLVRRVHRRLYPRVRGAMELKFHSSPERARTLLCAGLARTDVVIVWRAAAKDGARFSSGSDRRRLYVDMCRNAVIDILRHVRASSVHIVLDRRSGGRSVRHRIDEELTSAVRMNHQGYFPPEVTVSHLDSAGSGGIQVTDFVAGAVFQSLERSNDEYLRMLSARVAEWHVE